MDKKGEYNPTVSEMIAINDKVYSEMLQQGHISEQLYRYFVDNQHGIVDMMNRVNDVDGNLDYQKVLVLVLAVYMRAYEE